MIQNRRTRLRSVCSAGPGQRASLHEKEKAALAQHSNTAHSMQSSMQHAMQHAACRADKGSMQHGNAAHSMNFAGQTEPAQGAKMGGQKIDVN